MQRLLPRALFAPSSSRPSPVSPVEPAQEAHSGDAQLSIFRCLARLIVGCALSLSAAELNAQMYGAIPGPSPRRAVGWIDGEGRVAMDLQVRWLDGCDAPAPRCDAAIGGVLRAAVRSERPAFSELWLHVRDGTRRAWLMLVVGSDDEGTFRSKLRATLQFEPLHLNVDLVSPHRYLGSSEEGTSYVVSVGGWVPHTGNRLGLLPGLDVDSDGGVRFAMNGRVTAADVTGAFSRSWIQARWLPSSNMFDVGLFLHW